ncbi:hypothetical protein AAG906_037016 [Vitis piasezkii]
MHQTRKRTEKSNSKANLAKTEVITTVVSSEVRLPGRSVGTEVHLLPIPL